MIVILCGSFQEAQDSFDIFMQFLNENEPFSIQKVYEHSYCVETVDDLRYIFVDYRFKTVFLKFNDWAVDFIDVHDFFEGMYDFYYSRYYVENLNPGLEEELINDRLLYGVS